MMDQHPQKYGYKTTFSLSSVLLLFLILGIILAIAIPNFKAAMSNDPQWRTAADFRAIHTALSSYQTDYSSFPQTDSASLFILLSDLGYYSGTTVDAWKQPIRYVSESPTEYTLWSYGEDKMPGASSEFGADIVLHNGEFTSPQRLIGK
jgi:competence protein ComGC